MKRYQLEGAVPRPIPGAMSRCVVVVPLSSLPSRHDRSRKGNGHIRARATSGILAGVN